MRPTAWLISPLLLFPLGLGAQPGGDTVAVFARAHAEVAASGPTLGPETWPGFRPDTIPQEFNTPVVQDGVVLTARSRGRRCGSPSAGWRSSWGGATGWRVRRRCGSNPRG